MMSRHARFSRCRPYKRTLSVSVDPNRSLLYNSTGCKLGVHVPRGGSSPTAQTGAPTARQSRSRAARRRGPSGGTFGLVALARRAGAGPFDAAYHGARRSSSVGERRAGVMTQSGHRSTCCCGRTRRSATCRTGKPTALATAALASARPARSCPASSLLGRDEERKTKVDQLAVARAFQSWEQTKTGANTSHSYVSLSKMLISLESLSESRLSSNSWMAALTEAAAVALHLATKRRTWCRTSSRSISALTARWRSDAAWKWFTRNMDCSCFRTFRCSRYFRHRCSRFSAGGNASSRSSLSCRSEGDTTA